MTSEKEKEIIQSVIGPIFNNGSVLVSIKDLRLIIQITIRLEKLKAI